MTSGRGGPDEFRAKGRVDEDFLNFPNTMIVKEREKKMGIPSSIWINVVRNKKVR